MPNTTHNNFPLNSGQNFTDCNTKSSRCLTPGIGVTSEDRVGFLVVKTDSDEKPIRADFYYPSQDACTGGMVREQCDLHAIFTGSELDQLIESNKQLQMDSSQGGDKSSQANGQGFNTGQDESTSSSTQGSFFDSVSSAPIYFPLGALVIVLLVVLGRKHIVRLVSPSQPRQRPSQRQRSETVSFQTQGLNQIFNPSLESSSEINRQLLPLIQKIDLLAARLDSLETELTVISQKSQPSVSFSTPPVQQTARPSQSVINNPVPKPRPSLDVDLIKLAVATSDYELIKAFPHNFVTETLESRQGMEEGLRFSIDGDQDQSNQRAQSEFIAIPYLNETYLIPNLVPNAADPARTIRRFVERNKLYRGTGDNLLSISVLATVDRSGDSYILRDSGRVG